MYIKNILFKDCFMLPIQFSSYILRKKVVLGSKPNIYMFTRNMYTYKPAIYN